jgi:hypothetical protein
MGFLEWVTIISLNSSNQLVPIMESQCLFSKAGMEYLNIVYINFKLQWQACSQSFISSEADVGQLRNQHLYSQENCLHPVFSEQGTSHFGSNIETVGSKWSDICTYIIYKK